MATFIPADESKPLAGVKPENGTNFTLQELYRLLECDTVECVDVFNGDVMICDEDAKFARKRTNKRATAMVHLPRVGELKQALADNPDLIVYSPTDWQSLPDDAKADAITGDVLVCKQDEFR